MKRILSVIMSLAILLSLIMVDGNLIFPVNAEEITNYYGMLYDEASDGGFEFGSWKPNGSISSSLATYKFDTSKYHRGSKSLAVTFKKSGSVSFYSIVNDLSEIEAIEDYCFTSYVLPDSKFKGTISLKIVGGDDPSKAGLIAANNVDTVTVCQVKAANKIKEWTRFDSSANPYKPASLQAWLGNNDKAVVVISITANAIATVNIDDIDFRTVSSLGDKEEMTRYDNTGAIGGDYVGLFDDSVSNGDFEKKTSWKNVSSLTTATPNSEYMLDPYVKNTGKRSARFDFLNNKEESFAIATYFSDISEINANLNYCFSLYVKTLDNFDGKIEIKLFYPQKETEAGALNALSSDWCLIYNTENGDDASKSWKKYVCGDGFYTASQLQNFLTDQSVTESNSIGLLVKVTGKQGIVWIDDLDFQRRDYALGDDETISKESYSGLIANGGFEDGLWTVDTVGTTAKVHSFSAIETDKGFVHSGNRSMYTVFRNNLSENFTYYTTISDLKDISTDSDWFFKAFVKSAAGFDGKISLKITAHNNASVILTNSALESENVIYDANLSGCLNAYSSVSSIKKRFTADAVKSFFAKSEVFSNGIDIYLTISGSTGAVWIDDIDLYSYNTIISNLNREDPETAYSPSSTDYKGSFDENTANGGFEYGVWKLDANYTDAQTPSGYFTDVDNKNTGKRSLEIDFNNNVEEIMTFVATSYKVSSLSSAQSVLSAFVKCSDDFSGSVVLKITKHDNYDVALLNNKGSSNTVLLSDAFYTRFTRVHSLNTPFTEQNISDFKTALGADSCFDIYVSVKATKGTVWIDDIDLMTSEELEEAMVVPPGEEVYDGIVENGGFEKGSWNASNLSYHSLEEVADDTYSDSYKAIQINSTKKTGYDGALRLTSKTVSGAASQLDISKKYTVSLMAKGKFDGSVYLEVKNGSSVVSYNFSTQIYMLKDNSVNFTDWHELVIAPFNVTGEDISITLIFDGVGSLLIDNVNIIPDPQSENLIDNGGFEYGAWTAGTADDIVSVDYNVTNNSAASLKMTGIDKESFVSHSLKSPLEPNKNYKATLSLKTVGVGYGGVYVRVLFTGNNKSKWATYHGTESLVSTGGTVDWRDYSIIIKDVPSDMTNAVFYVYIKGNGTLYVDNIFITDKVTSDDLYDKQPDISGAVYDGNVYNGGFEQDYWPVSLATDQTVSIDNTVTHNDSLGSLKVVGTEFKGYGKSIMFSSYTVTGATSEFNLSEKYCVGLYLKTSADFEGSVYVRVYQGSTYKWHNYETELYFTGHSKTPTSGYTNWTYLTTPTFDVTADDIYLSLYVDGKGTAWIDDLSMVVDPQADNILNNGGFENGIWSTWGSENATRGDKVELVNDVTCGSAKAGKLSSISDESGFFIVAGSKAGKFDPTKTYKLNLSLKLDGVKTDGVIVRLIQWYTPEGETTEKNQWLTAFGSEDLIKVGGTEDWADYSITLSKWRPDATHFNLYVNLYGSGTVWVDNVSITEKVISDVQAGIVSSDTESGEVPGMTLVSLYTGDSNADIYYTIDGTDPRNSTTTHLYNDSYGILINSNVTLKAFAYSEDSGAGEVSEWKYTCSKPVVDDDSLWPNNRVNGTVSLDKSIKKQGNSSIKIKGNGGPSVVTSTGHLSFNSDFDYKLDFWVKTEGMTLDDSCFVSVFLTNSSNHAETHIDGTKGCYYISNKHLCHIEKEQDWTHYEFLIDDLNGNYSTINISAGVNYDFGTLWLDGVNLVPLAHNTYPISVWGDDERFGNIYTESTLSNFVIEQGFLVKNAAKNMETGIIKYQVVADKEPEKIIANGEYEMAVRGNSTTLSNVNLSMVSEYGTYTIIFSYKSSATGAEYPCGSITVSRMMDSTALISESLLGINNNYVSEVRTEDFVKSAFRNFTAGSIGMVRCDLDWETVERQKGVYSIPDRFDSVIDMQIDAGISPMVILNAHTFPSFYYPDSSRASKFPENSSERTAFVNFVKYVVSHFKGRVYTYELFNETNFMPYSKTDPENYVKLLKEVYGAIKSIDPDVKLVAGALSLTDTKYAEGIFQCGGADYMDYFSFHPYIEPDSPESVDWVEQIKSIRKIIEKYTKKDIHFILSEVGYSAIKTTLGVTEWQKLQYFVRMFAFAKTCDYVDKIIIYNTNCGLDLYNLESQWGLFGNAVANKVDSVANSARPVIVGLSAFTNMTKGYTFDSTVELAKGLYALKFNGAKKDMYLLWTNNSDGFADITTTDESARVYDIFGNYVITSYDNNLTFNMPIGGNMSYVTLDKGSSITKVKLLNDIIPSEDLSYSNEDLISSDKKSDEGRKTQVVKRRKKIVKVVKKNSDDETNWLLIVILSGCGALLIGGAIALLIILLKRKKRKENSGT